MTPCLAALSLLPSLPICLLPSRGLGLVWHLTSRSGAGTAHIGSFLPPSPPTKSLTSPLLSLFSVLPLSPDSLHPSADGLLSGCGSRYRPRTMALGSVARPTAGEDHVVSVPFITYTQVQSGSEAVDSKRPPAEPLKQVRMLKTSQRPIYGDNHLLHMALLWRFCSF